ncbi:YiiD C-terminal domain-containing protein [uncultured Pseudoteredinibacter sp.]|uniref:YiiD C-terminal domain-containing protein n=1 Tax=uncultured Pseudoteredinibacter sp. TaxID=1641701 RepID=UPI00260C9943|nr:YiiD C-terminal domain-containing protein [uncultured Pseudoteredinibacter sp.]
MINLEEFTSEIHRDIPLSQHMGFRFCKFNCAIESGADLYTELPLAPNLNDKNTAFGGSIATLATLSGWSLVTLISRQLDLSSEVVVYHSEQSFDAPITADLHSIAKVPTEDLESFADKLEKEGRAKLTVDVEIFGQANSSQQPASASARYTGKYLATVR